MGTTHLDGRDISSWQSIGNAAHDDGIKDQDAAIWVYYGRLGDNYKPGTYARDDVREPVSVQAGQTGHSPGQLQSQSCPSQHYCSKELATLYVISRFTQGYQDAGGISEYLGHIINDVIPCESTWQPDPNSPEYYGLGQFIWSTWVSVRRSADADFRDPYEQGWAIAVNARDNDPRYEWPSCWMKGGD